MLGVARPAERRLVARGVEEGGRHRVRACRATPHEVKKALQPPCVGGSFLVRRATSVCQSIACRSTLKPAASSCGLATGGEVVVAGDVGLVQEHDRRAVVARFLQQLLGLGDVARRACPPSPWSISSGEPQGNSDLHSLVVVGIADIGLEERLLVERVEHGLAHLGVVERLVQHVEAHARTAGRPCSITRTLTFLSFCEQRQQVGRHALDQVDLAVEQRVHLGLRVGDRRSIRPGRPWPPCRRPSPRPARCAACISGS